MESLSISVLGRARSECGSVWRTEARGAIGPPAPSPSPRSNNAAAQGSCDARVRRAGAAPALTDPGRGSLPVRTLADGLPEFGTGDLRAALDGRSDVDDLSSHWGCRQRTGPVRIWVSGSTVRCGLPVSAAGRSRSCPVFLGRQAVGRRVRRRFRDRVKSIGEANSACARLGTSPPRGPAVSHCLESRRDRPFRHPKTSGNMPRPRP